MLPWVAGALVWIGFDRLSFSHGSHSRLTPEWFGAWHSFFDCTSNSHETSILAWSVSLSIASEAAKLANPQDFQLARHAAVTPRPDGKLSSAPTRPVSTVNSSDARLAF
ncbi:uncharacterized protein BDR25DRAFT_307204 [Lindgomyces ingoldianus]|uniref:Uncharacterized protein n=1 Tax=Lindgomyces ingoldianus TaxID=673940 RepID=A0ACB6QDC2_9PLEO|nr:uncharacterized protein BDR25DRAFT_307204 [Lindgomyces ingoldianus]KAF2464500.1 hypothetical protein BDR25DRAFT_307204 [Lindgomyces ingoldianus]